MLLPKGFINTQISDIYQVRPKYEDPNITQLAAILQPKELVLLEEPSQKYLLSKKSQTSYHKWEHNLTCFFFAWSGL